MRKPVLSMLVALWLGAITFPTWALVAIDHPDPESYSGLVRTRLIEAQEAFAAAQRENGKLTGEDYGRLAMTYDANDMVTPATQAYGNAAELSAYDARWPYFLGLLAYRKGDFTAAERHFRKSIELNPEYRPAQVRLGIALIEQGSMEPARLTLETLVAGQPNLAVARAELGKIYIQTGDFAAALEHLEAALALQPQATRLNYQVGVALRGLGRQQEAREWLEKSGDGELIFRDPLNEAVRSLSGSANYWNNLAHRTLATGDLETGIRLLFTAVAADPDNIYPVATLALTLTRVGRSQEGLVLLQDFEERNPGEALAQFAWGLILSFMDNDSDAITRFRAAFQASPDMLEPIVQAAHASLRVGRHEQAAALYERAQGLVPNDLSLTLYRSAALSVGGRCRDAMDSLVLSIPLAPESHELLRTYARVAATCPQATQEERQNALNAARNLYRVSRDIYTLDTLALVEAAQGKPDEAEALLLEAKFHAATRGHEEHIPMLDQRLGQVRDGSIVRHPWPEGHPLMTPPKPRLADGVPGALTAQTGN